MVSNVEDRLRYVEKLIQDRKKRQDQPRQVSWKLITLTCIFIVASLFAGIFIGLQSNFLLATADKTQTENHYEIGGYEFYMIPGYKDRIQGINGFVNHVYTDKIFLRKDLELGQLEETCNHELMHAMGMTGNSHWFINENDMKVNSGVCDELVSRVEEDRYG